MSQVFKFWDYVRDENLEIFDLNSYQIYQIDLSYLFVVSIPPPPLSRLFLFLSLLLR